MTVPLDVDTRAERVQLRGAGVFLSASIPDPRRWSGQFDPLAITDAIVAVARAVLGADGVLITAAHPTIAPLVLYVARELRGPSVEEGPRRVVVYQSRVYEEVMPTETRRFEEEGVGDLRFTPAVEGDLPIAGQEASSLRLMRETMLDETQPAAMVVVGGMPGVAEEVELFRERFDGRPVYVIASPGGIAAELVNEAPEPLVDLLVHERAYPFLARRVVEHLAAQLPT